MSGPNDEGNDAATSPSSTARYRAARWVMIWSALYSLILLIRFGKLMHEQAELVMYARLIFPGLVAAAGFQFVGRIRAGQQLRGGMWFILLLTMLIGVGVVLVAVRLITGEIDVSDIGTAAAIASAWSLVQVVCGIISVCALRTAIREDVVRVFE